MELGLVREVGSKALLAGGVTLLGYWIYNAVRLVLDARGINPLIKQFFTQEAAGRIDAAYLLTKTYRQHVNRQQFICFLAGLKLNKFRNLNPDGPGFEDSILTVKLKAENDEELLDFTFTKVDEEWRIAGSTVSMPELNERAAELRGLLNRAAHAYYVLDARSWKTRSTTGCTANCSNWSR